jgi:hypothetical protein
MEMLWKTIVVSAATAPPALCATARKIFVVCALATIRRVPTVLVCQMELQNPMP